MSILKVDYVSPDFEFDDLWSLNDELLDTGIGHYILDGDEILNNEFIRLDGNNKPLFLDFDINDHVTSANVKGFSRIELKVIADHIMSGRLSLFHETDGVGFLWNLGPSTATIDVGREDHSVDFEETDDPVDVPEIEYNTDSLSDNADD